MKYQREPWKAKDCISAIHLTNHYKYEEKWRANPAPAFIPRRIRRWYRDDLHAGRTGSLVSGPSQPGRGVSDSVFLVAVSTRSGDQAIGTPSPFRHSGSISS